MSCAKNDRMNATMPSVLPGRLGGGAEYCGAGGGAARAATVGSGVLSAGGGL